MKRNQRKQQGFTLIEMVGVLAVIAILAALLVPRIFAAIEESRYNNTVASINSVKTATMGYYAKNGAFVVDTANPHVYFDSKLLQAKELERPFAAKIGTAVECDVKAITDAGVEDGNRFNKLDGVSLAASGNVVQCKLTGVSPADAWELSKRIDGTALSAADAASVDDLGRVIYDAPGTATAVDVYVYIAHK